MEMIIANAPRTVRLLQKPHTRARSSLPRSRRLQVQGRGRARSAPSVPSHPARGFQEERPCRPSNDDVDQSGRGRGPRVFYARRGVHMPAPRIPHPAFYVPHSEADPFLSARGLFSGVTRGAVRPTATQACGRRVMSVISVPRETVSVDYSVMISRGFRFF